MEKAERLQEFFRYLQGSGRITSQMDFASAVGMSRTNVSSALKGDEKVLTTRLIARIERAFGDVLKKGWIERGEGDMLLPHVANPQLEELEELRQQVEYWKNKYDLLHEMYNELLKPSNNSFQKALDDIRQDMRELKEMVG